jgi:hypothetical protein
VLTPFLLAGRQQKNDFRLSFSLCESSEAGGKKTLLDCQVAGCHRIYQKYASAGRTQKRLLASSSGIMHDHFHGGRFCPHRATLKLAGMQTAGKLLHVGGRPDGFQEPVKIVEVSVMPKPDSHVSLTLQTLTYD